MSKEGQGSPEGAPKKEDRAPQKEQGSRQKESAANNSLVFPIEQKLSEPTKPIEEGETRIRSVRPAVYRPPLKVEVPDYNKFEPSLAGPRFWFNRWRKKDITDEKLQESSGYWLEVYKTWSKQKLKNDVMEMEKEYSRLIEKYPEREQAFDNLKYEMTLKQQELQRRKT